MDLRTFITETLCQISDGMIDAQTALKDKGVRINPPHQKNGDAYVKNKPGKYVDINAISQSIEFDIALTTSTTSGGKGGGSISVLSMSLKAEGGKEDANSSVSRVRFTLVVDLPACRPDGM